jgi:hypothetical protein
MPHHAASPQGSRPRAEAPGCESPYGEAPAMKRVECDRAALGGRVLGARGHTLMLWEPAPTE